MSSIVLSDRIRIPGFRPGKTKYVAVREVDGWIKSRVFGKSFKLTRKIAADAASNYRLQVR